jgi:hypothetical protein
MLFIKCSCCSNFIFNHVQSGVKETAFVSPTAKLSFIVGMQCRIFYFNMLPFVNNV